MKPNTLSLIIGVAIAFSRMSESDWTAAHMTKGEQGTMLSVAAKKSPAARQREVPGQIACTIYGCYPIPPGCHPETGYNWDGIPTGFDIVVCRPQHRRRG